MTSAPPVARARDRVLAFADCVEAGNDRTTPEAAVQWETWVTFRLGAELYGLAVTTVREIVRVETITRVPHAPNPIRGIVNLRGRVVPVLDLRVRLGLAAADITTDTRILVCQVGERVVGLLVDAAHQVMRVDRRRVEAPPADVVSGQTNDVDGVCEQGAAFVILLKADSVLLIPDGLAGIETNSTPAPSGQPEHEG